jgi:prolyl-tRNA editing enzyme YbaK/EbsC (Cys-tRNA(Pro) deacylase)
MQIDPKYHSTVSQIINLLEKNNYWFEIFEHEPVRTSDEAARTRNGYSLHQGAKALIVRVKIT